MIYTSYFAKLKSLSCNIIPISICAKAPSWYTGLQYKKLAPKYDFFMRWKQTHDNDYYIKCFDEQVLNNLKASEVISDLKELVIKKYGCCPEHIALICYEKPTDFCHRHLVAKWLKENGYECKEWAG